MRGDGEKERERKGEAKGNEEEERKREINSGYSPAAVSKVMLEAYTIHVPAKFHTIRISWTAPLGWCCTSQVEILNKK